MAYVGVVGPGSARARDEQDARELGRGLAGRGHVVLCGGLGGVMDAVAAGVRDGDGVVVGLLPGNDRADGSPHLTVALPTGMGEMRNALLVRSSDVVLSVGGSWGTLSEVALALRTGVPVVALDGWRVLAADGSEPGPTPVRAGSVAEALAAVDEIVGGT
ncbi:TIGR00725 family protein [Cellulomonas chitinilytica]|uniref:TIGR00725 family protein n=1 Tax=Cellulomonas chitinilytica TaxID=398759 RepID=A0A919P2D0_9CELL|nr:TIGR00725 family protein [Cellulomonas chitinilytica]GIG20867.1 TIGR00725 family protein [Cellulomonas chitinilytica]